MAFNIETRVTIVLNTDPQKRCYNGCFARTELVWSAWEVLNINVPPEEVEDKLKFWRELNDYAVSQRGKEAKKEFRAVECV
jgi:hypothetical protein